MPREYQEHTDYVDGEVRDKENANYFLGGQLF